MADHLHALEFRNEHLVYTSLGGPVVIENNLLGWCQCGAEFYPRVRVRGAESRVPGHWELPSTTDMGKRIRESWVLGGNADG